MQLLWTNVTNPPSYVDGYFFRFEPGKGLFSLFPPKQSLKPLPLLSVPD